jgi:hypothetical protein
MSSLAFLVTELQVRLLAILPCVTEPDGLVFDSLWLARQGESILKFER